MGTHPAESSFSAFLHYITKAACELQHAGAFHHGALHRQQFTTHGGIGQAIDHADAVGGFQTLATIPGSAQITAKLVHAHGHLPGILIQHFHCGLAYHLAQHTLQLTHARLAGIVLNHGADQLFRHADTAGFQAVSRDLFGQKMLLGNTELFFLGIAGYFDDLQTVPESRRDGIHAVGGGDEHHPAQIEGEFHVVIPEGVILLAIQHFQKSCGGIAMAVPAQFIDLVKEEHRIHGTGLFEARNDPARNGCYIGTPVTADLCFIPHAAQRHLHKLTPHCLGNGTNDRGLTHAGRARKAKDGALHVLLHAQHGKVFDDALLDLFHAIVILIQHLAGTLQIQLILGGFLPGQIQDPLDIGTGHVDLRDSRRHLGETVDFLLGLLAGFLIQRSLGQTLPEFFNLGAVLVAQFGLDGFDLLTQVVVLLVLLDLGLDAALHLLFHTSKLDLPQHDGADRFQPIG